MKSTNIFVLAIAIIAGVSTSVAQQPNGARQEQRTESSRSLDERVVTNERSAEAVAEENSGAEEKGLRFNFRGVPLETVLDYMSKAAGFVILPKVDIQGTVNVWSYQPLSKDEAVDLLNTILNENGYAAIRNGKTLKIVSRDEAKTLDLPVKVFPSGSDPNTIPKNDEMVTEIISVRYANAVQLTQDLQPLLPEYATLTANESGNAIVLTDTQASIRRMAEIIQALDTSIANISAIRVFPLNHADATELAEIVKDLFETPTTNQRNSRDPRAQFFARMSGRGGGDRGGDRGGSGGSPSGTGVSEARNAASRVVSVADERTNSLVVSAPEEYIATIENLVEEIDKAVDDVTELQVFHLKNSDPVEMAELLAELFPDETQTQGRGTGGFRFGGLSGRGGGPPRGGRSAGNDQSERMKKMGRVMAVPDERTSSIVVTAASQIMPQIAEMIKQLDANPAKKQKVFVYSLENADVQNIEEILRGMFEGQNSRSLQNNSNRNNQNNNPLNNRNAFNQGGGGGSFGGRSGSSGGGQTRR